MPKKPKFKPQVKRIKLSPEQAVLQCTCYDSNTCFDNTSFTFSAYCDGKSVTFGSVSFGASGS